MENSGGDQGHSPENIPSTALSTRNIAKQLKVAKGTVQKYMKHVE